MQQEINEYEQTKGQSNPEKLRAVNTTEISEIQQGKVDRFLSNKTEKDEDAAAIKQQEARRMARMAYMQRMER